MNMFKVAALSLTVSALALTSCEETAEGEDQKVVQEQQRQYQVAQPIPQFDFSLERDIVVQLYQARNQNVATHTVWRSDLGTVEGDCPSIGYPIPFDTSLTNPLQAVRVVRGGERHVVEQAEPNGVFASKNSIATWVRCIVEEGNVAKQVPVYIESRVTAYPFAVSVDYDTNRVTQAGAASLVIQENQ